MQRQSQTNLLEGRNRGGGNGMPCKLNNAIVWVVCGSGGKEMAPSVVTALMRSTFCGPLAHIYCSVPRFVFREQS